jgi:2-C-methyl-D-erythritol 4-phosphate cytidylyltransferase
VLVPAAGESVALGVVPVGSPAGAGGDGVPALWRVFGIPLVRRAVTALAEHVGEVVVPVPSGLEGPVSAALAGCRARVLPVPGVRPGPLALLAAALRAGDVARFDAVAILDPLHLPLRASLVPAVLGAVRTPEPGAPTAAAVAGPVTDTLIWVGTDDGVSGTADRDRFREVLGLQAYRTEALVRSLDAVDPTTSPESALARLATAADACWLPRTADVFAIAAADDLTLAESLLDPEG